MRSRKANKTMANNNSLLVFSPNSQSVFAGGGGSGHDVVIDQSEVGVGLVDVLQVQAQGFAELHRE